MGGALVEALPEPDAKKSPTGAQGYYYFAVLTAALGVIQNHLQQRNPHRKRSTDRSYWLSNSENRLDIRQQVAEQLVI